MSLLLLSSTGKDQNVTASLGGELPKSSANISRDTSTMSIAIRTYIHDAYRYTDEC